MQVVIGLCHEALNPGDINIIMAFVDLVEEMRASEHTHSRLQVGHSATAYFHFMYCIAHRRDCCCCWWGTKIYLPSLKLTLAARTSVGEGDGYRKGRRWVPAKSG